MELSEDLYTNLDADNMNNDHVYDRIVFSRWAAVCLGLLCIVLLGLVAWMTIRHTAEKEELLASNKLLAEDRNQSISDLQNRATFFENQWFQKLFRTTYPQTWNESKKYCKERGGDLVVIRNKWEHVSNTCKRMTGWLGLTDQGHDGTWRWVDGSALTLQFWRYGQPRINNGRDDCVFLHSNKHSPESNLTWNYYDCSTQYGAVCEKKC
uniref:C-type lectin domain-containing protein n=1 Tax=Denticeps clupeoides TaxID=299321 RepID=A0AAY4ARC2_9TELE